MSKSWQFRTRIRDKVTDDCKFTVSNLLEPYVNLRWSIAQLLASDWLNTDANFTKLTNDERMALNLGRNIERKPSKLKRIASTLNIIDRNVKTIKDLDELSTTYPSVFCEECSTIDKPDKSKMTDGDNIVHPETSGESNKSGPSPK